MNLRHNPDEPIEAIAIAKAILAMKHAEASTSNEIIVGPKAWGEILYVAQDRTDAGTVGCTPYSRSRGSHRSRSGC